LNTDKKRFLAARFRSTNNNIQDWVPFYRYLAQNERSKLAVANKDRRDVILGHFLDKVERAVREGIPVSCLSQGLLQEKGASRLTNGKLSLCRRPPFSCTLILNLQADYWSTAEIRSVNVSLVSGGFETLSTTGSAGLAFLATSEGRVIQERAYRAILSVYSTPEEAWERSLQEETVPYIVALVREMLRYYAPIQLLPPRQTAKAFSWRGAIIPEGVGIFQNAQAINHDNSAYGPDADRFRPERWLDDEKSDFNVGPPYHYSFGAGSRMCTAVALSNRILYATFLRLILHFEFTASESSPPTTDYVDINSDRTGQTVMVKPYQVLLKRRTDCASLKSSLKASEEATKDVPIV
jgi:phenylacetate 2-hydroxylase